jgi:hypothetical protein
MMAHGSNRIAVSLIIGCVGSLASAHVSKPPPTLTIPAYFIGERWTVGLRMEGYGAPLWQNVTLGDDGQIVRTGCFRSGTRMVLKATRDQMAQVRSILKSEISGAPKGGGPFIADAPVSTLTVAAADHGRFEYDGNAPCGPALCRLSSLLQTMSQQVQKDGKALPFDLGTRWFIREGEWHGRSQELKTMWAGDWLRRGDTNQFGAEWRNVDTRQQVRDTIEAVDVGACEVTLHRTSVDEDYHGYFSPDDPSQISGTADKFGARVVWTASIEYRQSAGEQQGHASEKPVGPASVWKPSLEVLEHLQTCQGAKPQPCLESQMKNSGASSEAMAFSRSIGFRGYLTAFRKLGRVDEGTVTDPFEPGGKTALFLLNGSPSPLDVSAAGDRVDVTHDAKFNQIAARFPRAALMEASYLRVAGPSGTGGQAFVYAFVLKNGCASCEMAGRALIELDFDSSGRFGGVQLAELARLDEATPWNH